MPKKGEVDIHQRNYWKSVLEDFAKSGLSGQQYCRQNGIKYTTFGNRRRRLAKAVMTTVAPAKKPSKKKVSRRNSRLAKDSPGFAEVTVRTGREPNLANVNVERLEVLFCSGTVLRVPNGYSSLALVELIKTLEE